MTNKIAKALLVDDNETTNFYNEDVIEETDLFEEIVVLPSGTETIEYFENIKEKNLELPNLMFLDINMPDYDGFEVLEALEELFEEDLDAVKVCMLTTSNHKKDIEKYEKFVNAVDYIAKPLMPERIAEVIEKHF
ncbi:MAG: response regulator [Crocinitomicaceae bacterium]